jgi:hypothetical protein
MHFGLGSEPYLAAWDLPELIAHAALGLCTSWS